MQYQKCPKCNKQQSYFRKKQNNFRCLVCKNEFVLENTEKTEEVKAVESESNIQQ